MAADSTDVSRPLLCICAEKTRQLQEGLRITAWGCRCLLRPGHRTLAHGSRLYLGEKQTEHQIIDTRTRCSKKTHR